MKENRRGGRNGVMGINANMNGKGSVYKEKGRETEIVGERKEMPEHTVITKYE